MRLHKIRSLLIFIMILAASMRGETKIVKVQKDTLDWQKADQIVDLAYRKSMRKYFESIAISAKKNRLAKDFVIDISGFGKGTSETRYLKEKLKNFPTPQILTIKNGIKVGLSKSSFTISLARSLGKILIDGKPVNLDTTKSYREQVESLIKKMKFGGIHLPSLRFGLPQAEASAVLYYRIILSHLKSNLPPLAYAVAEQAALKTSGDCLRALAMATIDSGIDVCLQAANQSVQDYSSQDVLEAAARSPKTTNPRVALLLKLFSVVAVSGPEAVDFVSAKAKALAESNGLVCSCKNIPQGSYDLDILKSGTKVGTLYSFSQAKQQFTFGETVVNAETPGVSNYIFRHLFKNKKATAPNYIPHMIKVLAQELVNEKNDISEKCRANPGQTFALYSSKITEAKTLVIHTNGSKDSRRPAAEESSQQ